MNLGLRYELQGPWSERFDKITYFDPGRCQFLGNGLQRRSRQCASRRPVPGQDGRNTAGTTCRFPIRNLCLGSGFAYSFDQKTVIRGGYGIFFIPNYVSFGTNPYIDPVSSATSNFFASNDQGTVPGQHARAYCHRPFSSNCTLGLAAGAANFTCTVGPFGPNLVAVAGRNPQPNVSQYAVNRLQLLRPPHIHQQKYGYVRAMEFRHSARIARRFLCDVAYAGSHGVHLEQFNTQRKPDPVSASSRRPPQQRLTGNSAKHCPASTALSLQPGSTWQLGACKSHAGSTLNRPFPQYGRAALQRVRVLRAVTTLAAGHGNQALPGWRHHAGGLHQRQTALQHRYPHLLGWKAERRAAWVSVQDWNNLKGECSLSSQDVSQRLVISYCWTCPSAGERNTSAE